MASKVLIISYYYPPENSISSRRPLAFAKAFQRQGYDVTVLTRHWDFDNYRNYSEFNKPSFKKTSSSYEEEIRTIRIGFYPIKFWKYFYLYGASGIDILFWLREITGKGINIEQNVFHNFFSFLKKHTHHEQYDVVVVTSFPINLLRLMHKVKKHFPITVCDIRDYYNNFIFKDNYHPTFLQKVQNRVFESCLAKWMSGISVISAVNEPILEAISKYNKSSKVKVLNGYESTITEGLRAKNGQPFTITTMGALYLQQDLSVSIEAFKCFLANKTDVKVLFLGLNMFPEVAQYIKMQLSNPLVEITDRVSRVEALNVASNSQVLFYAGWKGFKGIYSGKMFEYLGLRRNIMLCPGDDDVLDELLRNTKAGKIANSAEEMVDQLEIWYKEWKSTGTVKYSGEESELAAYTREYQSDILVDAVKFLK